MILDHIRTRFLGGDLYARATYMRVYTVDINLHYLLCFGTGAKILKAPSKIWVKFDTFLSSIYLRDNIKKSATTCKSRFHVSLHIGNPAPFGECWCNVQVVAAHLQVHVRQPIFNGHLPNFSSYKGIIPLGYCFRFVLALFFVLVHGRNWS